MRTIARLLLLLLIMISGSCSFGDQAAIKSSVTQVFQAAQRGDIAFALDFLSSQNPTKQLLLAKKSSSDQEFDRAVADLGTRTRQSLETAKLQVHSITIEGNRARVECSIIGSKRKWEGSIRVIQENGQWLLFDLPNLP